jgi:hypothetical protein
MKISFLEIARMELDDAIEYSRRLSPIAGHKPIPIHTKLACLGWEVLHAQQAA